MKKWIYLIIPGTLLGLFLVVYFSHQKETEAKEQARKVQLEQKLIAEAKQKKEAEDKAREDANRRQQEREAEERKKEAERRAKQEAEDRKVTEATRTFKAEADAAQKRVNELEVQLKALQQSRDALTRETFELAKQVELAKVAKRNAELEEQRYVEMIARKTSESSLARPPVIPQPAGKS